jgi:hypothetical protein
VAAYCGTGSVRRRTRYHNLHGGPSSHMAYQNRTLPDAMVVLTFLAQPLGSSHRHRKTVASWNLRQSLDQLEFNSFKRRCAQLQQRLPYACLCMSGSSRYRGAHHEDLCKNLAHRVEQSNASLKGYAPFVFALRLQHDICPHLKKPRFCRFCRP